MISKNLLGLILTAAAPLCLEAQPVLGAGDSRTWQFEFAYRSTLEINHPDQPFGGSVLLDYVHLAGAGSLDYRLDFLEDASSLQPVLSTPVHHLTGLTDQTGMPVIWVPEFAAPEGAWSDLNGALRLTVVAGQMKNLIPQISMLSPSAPGFMNYYEAVFIPEPHTIALLALGSLFLRAGSRQPRG